MKLRFLVVCLAIVLMNLPAFAQDNPSPVNASTASTTGVGPGDVGLYVNPIGIGIRNSQPDTGVFAFLGDGTTKRTFFGADIGGYVNFYHAQKYDAGLDIRDVTVSANNARLNSFMVGGRVAAKPLAEKFKPYAQLSVGVGSSKAPHSNVRVSKFQFGIYGGLDYTLSKHVDFRAFELGYGSVSTINSGNFNGATTFPNSSLFSVSAGLVFRVP
jgi:hypothetical protein